MVPKSTLTNKTLIGGSERLATLSRDSVHMSERYLTHMGKIKLRYLFRSLYKIDMHVKIEKRVLVRLS